MIITSIDVQTTGPEVDYHEIVGLTCIKFNANTWKTISKFNTDVRPIHVSRVVPTALEKNGHTLEVLETFNRVAIAKSRFGDWVDNMYSDFILPMSHDWARESSFIEAWLGRTRFNDIFGNPAIPMCTKSMAGLLMDCGMLPEMYPSLDNLTEYFNIPHTELDANSDAECTILLYKKLKELIKK